MNSEIRTDMKLYFYGNIGPLLLTIGGFVIGLFVILIGQIGQGLTVILVAIITGPIWKRAQLSATNANAESKYDDYVKEDMKNFKTQAMERLGIVEEQVNILNPVDGVGPLFDAITPEERKGLHVFFQSDSELRFKLGADNKVRYSMLQATIFFFSEEQIYVYQVDYDICSSKIFGDRTYEYFYRDIDCVITGKRIETVDKKKKVKKDYEYFSVIVTSGTSTKAVSDSETSILDDQVRGMRRLIRNKKQEMA